jgi:NADP-dependent 3-hydroxy acid dehydrogenase YdfG
VNAGPSTCPAGVISSKETAMPVIAIVAAGARLGLSLGKTFGRQGFEVALLARSEHRLGELTEKLTAEGVKTAGFPADVTDRAMLTAALHDAAERLGPINVLHFSAPPAGSSEAARNTGALEVTVDDLAAQIESICHGAITATRTVLPTMLAAGTGTLLYTTGASSVLPVPMFVGAGMAGAALRKWVLTLNSTLAGKGIYAGHVAIGAWIAGTPGIPDDAQPKHPDDIARLYWALHTTRDTPDRLVTA